MKYCTNCGEQLADDAKFCSKCGARQDVEEQTPQKEPENSENVLRNRGGESTTAPEKSHAPALGQSGWRRENQTGPTNKKYRNIGIAVVAAAVVVVLIVIISAIAGRAGSTIDLTDYITDDTAEISGADGSGSIDLYSSFNWSKYHTDLYKILQKKGKIRSATEEALENASYSDPDLLYLYTNMNRFTISMDEKSQKKDSSLKNGDKITCEIDGDAVKEYMKACGITLKDGKKTIRVKDLGKIETKDFFENVTPTYSGANGYGSADGIEGSLPDGISYYFSGNGSLSNGDSVEMTIYPTGYMYDYNYDENEEYADEDILKGFDDYAQEYLEKPTAIKKSFEVSGLEELPTFDPFEDLAVHCSGVSTYGEIEFTGGDPTLNYKWVCDNGHVNGELENGDTITVTVSNGDSDDFKSYIDMYGKVPSKTVNTYTLNKFDTYATSLEDIPQETLDAINQQALDAENAYIAANWSSNVVLKSIQPIGYYFLTGKRTDTDPYNKLYELFQIDCSPEGGSLTFFWYVTYSNIVIDADGKCTLKATDGDYPGNYRQEQYYFYDKNYSYYGFENLDTAQSKLVTAQGADYNCEVFSGGPEKVHAGSAASDSADSDAEDTGSSESSGSESVTTESEGGES